MLGILGNGIPWRVSCCGGYGAFLDISNRRKVARFRWLAWINACLNNTWGYNYNLAKCGNILFWGLSSVGRGHADCAFPVYGRLSISILLRQESFWYLNTIWKMSSGVRKPTICICEKKDADQLCGNHTTDQRLCFCYLDSTIPLLPKYKISSI